jgi:NAD-dependent SIR2 family protein deacetylase
MGPMPLRTAVDPETRALLRTHPVLLTCGAGLGVDSGLPDFRGVGGWWRRDAPDEVVRLEDRATPAWFDDDPAEAWAFYRARQALYARTAPHAGFDVLRDLLGDDGFVFTSNVDGHLQRAGIPADRIVEIHGSLARLQCAQPCSRQTWPDDGVPVPRCPHCDGVARPNVCLFADRRWIAVPSVLQGRRYDRWLGRHERIVVLEIGAGTAVPNVRRESERLLAEGHALLRVNPHEPEGPPGTRSFAMAGASFLAGL